MVRRTLWRALLGQMISTVIRRRLVDGRNSLCGLTDWLSLDQVGSSLLLRRARTACTRSVLAAFAQMQNLRILSLTVSASFAVVPYCLADVKVVVDLSDQLMAVSRSEESLYLWKVSTGSGDFQTPTGVFRPIRMNETWFSRKYNGAAMPFSVFFYGGYAIHGTLDTRTLGRPVSRGCVRLNPENAKLLFDLVKKEGMSHTAIIIQD